MATQTRHGYIDFPAEWEHVETHSVGPFVTRVVHRRGDGVEDVRTSRRHRKNLGPEPAAAGRLRWLLWRPSSLNWWIAVLFMIGSWHFVSGSVLVLVGLPNVYLIDLIFFVGSIFFTAAGYSQYFQSINAPTAIDSEGRTQAQVVRRYLGWQPRRIDFWATFPQFLGTLAFNVTTFAAFASVGWLGYEVIVWVPDYVGSILFLVSGVAAVVEFCHRLFCWKRRDLTWWIVVINFAGCVAFMLSAILAYYLPVAIFGHLATWSTIFTLIGAVCFFVGSYLMWPEMSAETA